MNNGLKVEPFDHYFLNGDPDGGFDYTPYIESQDPEQEIPTGPHLAIIEQPKQRGFRFRYVCEGPSHGGLPGASSEKGKKTYPTVKIFNYVGMAKIEVDLVTHTEPPRVHAHSLVGKHANETGSCVVTVGPKDMTAQFNNLGIVHVTKKSQIEILKEKIRQQIMRTRCLTEQDEKDIEGEVKDLKKVTDLSIVRLRFTAYLPDSTGAYTLRLKPVISDPIHDSKSPGASNLRISRMDKTAGSVKGGDEVYLLCDKVQKDDIEVRFYEDDENGWEAFGDFSPTDVHKQYAIVFRTPPYHKQKIDRPVTVFLQLKRKRGGDVSDSKQFTYYPLDQDKEEVERKRRKDIPSLNHSFGGGAPMGGAGGGGSGGFGHAGGNNMNYSYGSLHGGYFTHTGTVYQSGYAMKADSSEASHQPVNIKKEADKTPCSPTQENVPSLQREYQETIRQAPMCSMRMLSLAQRTSKALMDYAVSADPRMLLAVQRPLTATRDENGDTPLHLALIHGQTAVIQQLVDVIRGVPDQKILNICNNLHQTPLHLAVITKQYQMVALLIRAGADPTILDRFGSSVLHLAVQAADDKMLQVLLDHQFSGYENLLNMPDYHGLFPVHWAAKVKNEKCLERLVKSGADVNAVERKSGRSPLHIAVEMNNLNMAVTLTKKLGANVNAQTFGGNTPLHLAACMGSPVLTKMLVNAGANVLIENDEPVDNTSCSDSDETDSDSDVDMDTDSDQQGDSDSEDNGSLFDTNQGDERIHYGAKRRYPGHTPLDLTKSQKVRDLLSKHPPGDAALKPHGQAPVNVLSLETNTVQRLEKLLNDGQTGSDWTELASRLRLQSLVDTYKNTPSPTENLLRSYELAGGSLGGLIKTLESMGVNEGVQLLCSSETYVKQADQAKGIMVDSAYGSESVDMEKSAESEPQKPALLGTTRLSPTQELSPGNEPPSGQ